MYIVAFPAEWYLRNTVATGDIARATRYANPRDALVALERAGKFMKRAAIKAAKIVEVEA
jgi:hypothetical protein